MNKTKYEKELKKALICCSTKPASCGRCPLLINCPNSKNDNRLYIDAFNLIDEYETRIEELENELSNIEANDY